MEMVKNQATLVRALVNDRLRDYEPWQIVWGSVGTSLVVAYLYRQLTHKTPVIVRLRKSLFRLVRRIPMVRQKFEQEVAKTRQSFEKELLSCGQHMQDHLELPAKGFTREEVLAQTKEYLGLGEFDWKEGTQSGTVYNGNPALTELMTEVYGLAAWTNPLHPDAFPGLRKMEAEIIRMSCDLFNGGPDSCGTVTSGGTESIVLAVKAYRDWARDVKGIAEPVIVVPITAHAAFDKACDLLDMTCRHVQVDPVTQRVDVAAMRRAICRRTCLLVGSAPQYAHGSVDDIQAIGKMGHDYGIPVHVDACLGGFLIAFMKDAGYPLKPFDFSVRGVTSISADTHKYGYAPKGSSVIMYSSEEYRHYQYFSQVDWPGGMYATSTIGGSRAGGIIAACWASLMYHGRDGYVDCTRKVVATTRYIAQQLRGVKGVKIIGDPAVSVVAIGSDEFNIYALSDLMKEKGWILSSLQFPSSVHLCCTMVHTKAGVADRFVRDVRESAETILADPEGHKGGSSAIYGLAQSIPDRTAVGIISWTYLDALYSIKGSKTTNKKTN